MMYVVFAANHIYFEVSLYVGGGGGWGVCAHFIIIVKGGGRGGGGQPAGQGVVIYRSISGGFDLFCRE